MKNDKPFGRRNNHNFYVLFHSFQISSWKCAWQWKNTQQSTMIIFWTMNWNFPSNLLICIISIESTNQNIWSARKINSEPFFSEFIRTVSGWNIALKIEENCFISVVQNNLENYVKIYPARERYVLSTKCQRRK